MGVFQLFFSCGSKQLQASETQSIAHCSLLFGYYAGIFHCRSVAPTYNSVMLSLLTMASLFLPWRLPFCPAPVASSLPHFIMFGDSSVWVPIELWVAFVQVNAFSEPGSCLQVHRGVHRGMEDIVNLGDNSHCPSSQMREDADCSYAPGLIDTQGVLPTAAGGTRAGGRSRGRNGASRSQHEGSQSLGALPHKLRGPNWTEQEMLVLISQKRIEWDTRHNCSQPALAKFVYGSTAWKLVLAGCMAVVSFRVRDADQLTNKWDGLIKDYKKLKDYIEGTGSGNWWAMNRDEKRDLCKTRRLPLEFSESMYTEMESFVGKRQIFGRAADVVDSDCLSSPPAKTFGRSPPSPRTAPSVGAGSPAASATTAPTSPMVGTPGDDLPGSTGRKRKAVCNDNLVDFVKDFNYDYLARVETQEREKRLWRSDVMALDMARESRIAHEDAEALTMDKKLYELEVERTKNLGNMTSALLMLATFMDTLTRFFHPPPSYF